MTVAHAEPRGTRAADWSRAAAAGERVLLIHGLASRPWFLTRIGTRLRKHGFQTQPWGYPSLRGGVEDHGRSLLQTLRELDRDPQVRQIHLVTHSLGGIVVRWALCQWRPEKLGRIVMLAPPHHGSRVAARLSRLPGGRLVRSLSELADGPQSLVNRLGVPEGLTVGILEARSDLVVSSASTHLTGETDHLVVPGMHLSMLLRRETARQVAAFLMAGRFDRTTA